MYSKKAVLIIGFIFIFFSCKEEISITFNESNFTSKNNEIVQVNIPIISNENDITKSINSIIKNTVIYALQTSEPGNITSNSIKESISSFNEEYNSFLEDFPDSAQKWEAQIDGEITLQIPDFICIAITNYINTGGAHGNLNITFLNFDAINGNLITNSNLFKDINGFKQIAETYFEKSIENEDDIFEMDNFQLPENIGFNEEGIILLYNTYEIAPYSTGIIEFIVPYKEAIQFLNIDSLQ